MIQLFPGCYLFIINVCTQDMKKVLLSIRKNGEEVGTVYDQNHIDNHRNSMAGNTMLVDLVPGDKVQVYMYTFSGLTCQPRHLRRHTQCSSACTPPCLLLDVRMLSL